MQNKQYQLPCAKPPWKEKNPAGCDTIPPANDFKNYKIQFLHIIGLRVSHGSGNDMTGAQITVYPKLFWGHLHG